MQKLGDFRAWCNNRKWHFLHTPATIGEDSNGKSSAGVAVFVRNHIGVREPESNEGVLVVAENRAVRVIIDIEGWPPWPVGSVYLRCGEGTSERNAEILRKMGMQPKTPMDLWGGDWNMAPQELEDSGFTARMRMCVLKTARKTCLTVQTASELDCFIAGNAMATVVKEARVEALWHIRPHRPVCLIIKDKVMQLNQLRVRQLQEIPVSKPVGPEPRPEDWSLAISLARATAQQAKFERIAKVDTMLTRTFQVFADTAEKELAAITGTEIKRPGLRATLPTAKWEDVMSKKLEADDEEQVSRGWTWLEQAAGSMQGHIEKEAEGGEAESAQEMIWSITQTQVPGSGIDARLTKATGEAAEMARRMQE